MKCPSCNHINVEEANFCSNCAHAISLKCPSCKHTNLGDSNYCINCSFNLRKEYTSKKSSLKSVQKIKDKVSKSGNKLNQAIKDNLSREDIEPFLENFISKFRSKVKRFFCQHKYAVKKDECIKCGEYVSRPKKSDQIQEENSISGLSFHDAVYTCYSKIFDFNGKASRSEFWWFYLYSLLIVPVASAILGLILPELGGLFFLISIIPMFSVWVRRLHDVDQPGWLILIVIIPIFGIIILFWFAAQKSKAINQYRVD